MIPIRKKTQEQNIATYQSLNNVVLTTFPAHKSQNVGDNLICNSTLDLIKVRKKDFSPQILFREKSLDGFSKKNKQNIIAPGFSVSNNVYPDLFSLYSDIDRLENFFPIGCSFQHLIPTKESFMQAKYNTQTLEFFKLLTDKFGALPCRDALIVEMLNDRFNISAIYSGDLAIYDEEKIGSKFTPPNEIKSVVFTIQHHLKYLEQSILLLKLIKKEFKDAKLYIAYHSVPGNFPKTIGLRAEELGFEILHQYGDTSNLNKYKNIDLHIGYRLHGHIFFLRNRKPSVLMVEDARSFGFANTKGTEIACFDAFDVSKMEPCEIAPEKAIEFVKSELKNNFLSYKPVFDFIDKNYVEFIVPYFDELSSKL